MYREFCSEAKMHQLKFPIVLRVNSRTFRGFWRTGILFKYFQSLEIVTVKFKYLQRWVAMLHYVTFTFNF